MVMSPILTCLILFPQFFSSVALSLRLGASATWSLSAESGHSSDIAVRAACRLDGERDHEAVAARFGSRFRVVLGCKCQRVDGPNIKPGRQSWLPGKPSRLLRSAP